MLERAWDQAPDGGETLFTQLQKNLAAAADDASTIFSSSSSNGHSASNPMAGSERPAATEIQRGWRKLLEKFRSTRKYLLDCSKYGLDAFTIKENGAFPDPLPSALPAASRVIVDTYGRWADLVSEYDLLDGISDSLIGAVVSDAAIFLWMMDNLVPVRESRGDYGDAIIGRAGGMLA